ncbi:MAG: hypothetical protein Q9221_003571 [Calogaya cf. arnoldii]
MADEFVDSCLHIFKDQTIDDDQRPEEVQKVLSTLSPLRGQQLESLTLRVAHLCVERIRSEAAASATPRPSAPRVLVHRPTRSAPSIQPSVTAQPSTTPSGALPSTTSRLNPNAAVFTPARPPSMSQHPNPNAAIPTTSSLNFSQHWNLSPQEQHARYDARIRSINAGIKLIDDYLILCEKARIRKAEAEIAALQSEHDGLFREFFENYPENKGTWKMYEGEGAKRVRGWTVREMQIDVLKRFIKECPENVLANLRMAREAFFEDFFPGEGEMGRGE